MITRWTRSLLSVRASALTATLALVVGASTVAFESETAGELRLACHLIEMAVMAEPDNNLAHGARAEIYTARRKGETSLMAHGIFGTAARESEKKA